MRIPKLRLPIAVRMTIWFSLALLAVLGAFAWFTMAYVNLTDPGWRFAGGLLAVVVLSKGVGYMLARRALSPIAELTRSARQIGSTDLSRRLPEPEGPEDELTDLARTFNRLIDRLESAVDRERQFADDVAHELLTPLAKLRPEIEMVLGPETSRAEMQTALRQVLTDIDEVTGVVRSLMELCRADMESTQPSESVDMNAIAQRCVREYRARAQERAIELTSHGTSSVRVRADKQQLREVFANLLDNALKYTPEGGEVQIEVRSANGWGRARIADTGIGFEPGSADELFDRFTRGSRKEVEDQDGTGLGLSIVKTLVDGWDGRIRAESDGPGTGATFVVDLPRDRAGDEHAERRR